MALFLKDPSIPSNDGGFLVPPPLDLAMPKHNLLPRPPRFPHHFPYNRISLPINPIMPDQVEICISPPPPMIPSLLTPPNPEAICEAAARILFMNVKWTKSIPAFATLCLSDILILLEQSWKDLFVLGAAQFLYPFDLKVLLDRKNLSKDIKKVEEFQKVLAEVAKVRPDNNEYTYLRAIVLFRTSVCDNPGSPTQLVQDNKRLQDGPTIAAMHNYSHLVLNEVRRIATGNSSIFKLFDISNLSVIL